MDLWGSSNLGGGGSSIATLPDQISNLACTGGTDGSHGTIDVSFTEVPATSFDLLKYYILIYKAGGIPQTPFDGVRIILPKGTAGAKLEHKITGLTFDQLYGIRIYPVSVKNQFQSLLEGATATVTPVAGIRLDSLMAGVNVDRIKLNVDSSAKEFLVLEHSYSNVGTLVWSRYPTGSSIFDGANKIYEWSSLDLSISEFGDRLDGKIRNLVLDTPIVVFNHTFTGITKITRKFFALSAQEFNIHVPSSYLEGRTIPFFTSELSKSITTALSCTRTGWPTSEYPEGVVTRRSNGSMQIQHKNEEPDTTLAFCLPGEMLFSTEPDADGCYIPL